MRIPIHYALIAPLLYFLICLGGCKKSPQPVTTPLTITSISPMSGPYSTIVTITGTGFNSNAAGDSVKFNGVAAVVQQASATQLTVIVPKAAGTGPVTVQSGSRNGTGPVFSFEYTITVTTLAGNGNIGFADGNADVAEFFEPPGEAVDGQGNVYVADDRNNRVRKITPAAVVSTFAGSGLAGFADGNGNTAQFYHPTGMAIDANGTLYVADTYYDRIRKVTPSAVVSTLAGNGAAGFADGNGATAAFNYPAGIATDAQGNVYVADAGNQRIRKITPSGVVTTLAGNGTAGLADGNGPGAEFNNPLGVTTDAQGNVYVADPFNNCIRKISPSGMVSTLAGSGTQGNADGSGAAAEFNYPLGIVADAQGTLYVTEEGNNKIRKITPSGVVTTLAGNGTAGFADGSGATAEFNFPWGIATDATGNVYVGDSQNNRIRMITIQ